MSDADNETITIVGAALFLALKQWTQWLWRWASAVIVVSLLIDASPFLRDDTDAPGWFAPRSHLRPATDALTGCQFLRASDGVAPRLDGRGRQIGCKDRS